MSSIRRRVLVTGGAGFLGSHLCERLVAQGDDVLCVDNYFTGRKDNIAVPYFEAMRHDITHPLFIEVDEIYNLACPASGRTGCYGWTRASNARAARMTHRCGSGAGARRIRSFGSRGIVPRNPGWDPCHDPPTRQSSKMKSEAARNDAQPTRVREVANQIGFV
jgi:nucleoside-diphosphate-sugar epimerase